MKLFFSIVFITIGINNTLFSQVTKDTVKHPDKIQLPNVSSIPSKDSEFINRKAAVSIEFKNENFLIPLNLKIYQKVLNNNYNNEKFYSYGELTAGMSEEELSAFDNNKKYSKKMFSDIYGTDLIDLKKILERLGISKDQIVALAGILKFLFYHPYLY